MSARRLYLPRCLTRRRLAIHTYTDIHQPQLLDVSPPSLQRVFIIPWVLRSSLSTVRRPGDK
jgi:hypothetical protein